MPEPLLSRLRPIRMKRLSLVVSLLVLAGCGSATDEGGKSGGATPSPSETTDACLYSTDGARRLATADLDGDGTREEVRLQPAAGALCPPALVAMTRVDTPKPRILVGELPDDEPPVTEAFAVALPGHDAHLVVTRQDHPRGGFQLRTFAAGEDDLVELKVDDHPLVPFVALDVQEHPLSVDCTDGGVVLTEAVPHEPVGVLFAWDIKRTAYAIDGTGVTPGVTEEIADNVLPKQLRSKYPELVRHAMFPSCRAAG